MTTINIHLHDSTSLTQEMTTYDANTLLAKLIDPKITVISAGNSVINKNLIKLISPVHPVDKVWVNPIEIKLHDGLTVKTEDSNFNADELAEQINDSTQNMNLVGDVIVAKGFIKVISPVTV